MNNWYKTYYREHYADSVRGLATSEATKADVAFILAQTNLSPGASVIDLACGHGRHALAFAEHGLNVSGVDQNANFIAQAKAEDSSGLVNFVVGDMRETFGGPYNMITILYHSFGFFSDAANRRLIEDWRALLQPGGFFALDLWNRDMIIRNFADQRVWQASDDLTVDERRAFDPLSGRLAVHYLYNYKSGEQYEYDASFRLYTLAELRDLFEQAGLVIHNVFSSLSGDPYFLDARRMIVFAQRPG